MSQLCVAEGGGGGGGGADERLWVPGYSHSVSFWL